MRWHILAAAACLAGTACGTTDYDDWTTYGGVTPLASEPRSCSPATLLGTCNVIDQCGCPQGEGCVWGFDEDRLQLFETCTGSHGTLGPGQPCDPTGSIAPCGLGTVCVDTGTGHVCHEWCRESTDCTVPGCGCTHAVTLDLVYPVAYPYLVCAPD